MKTLGENTSPNSSQAASPSQQVYSVASPLCEKWKLKLHSSGNMLAEQNASASSEEKDK